MLYLTFIVYIQIIGPNPIFFFFSPLLSMDEILFSVLLFWSEHFYFQQVLIYLDKYSNSISGTCGCECLSKRELLYMDTRMQKYPKETGTQIQQQGNFQQVSKIHWNIITVHGSSQFFKKCP